MSVEEILAAELPEGIYLCGLECFKAELQWRTRKEYRDNPNRDQMENNKWIDSLCASFSALYELAEWDSLGSHSIEAIEETCEQAGRVKAIAEVRGIVEDLSVELVDDKGTTGYSINAEELSERLAALESTGESGASAEEKQK